MERDLKLGLGPYRFGAIVGSVLWPVWIYFLFQFFGKPGPTYLFSVGIALGILGATSLKRAVGMGIFCGQEILTLCNYSKTQLVPLADVSHVTWNTSKSLGATSSLAIVAHDGGKVLSTGVSMRSDMSPVLGGGSRARKKSHQLKEVQGFFEECGVRVLFEHSSDLLRDPKPGTLGN